MRDFDVSLFKSLPMGEGGLVGPGGTYCALGAAARAMGMKEDQLKSIDALEFPYTPEFKKFLCLTLDEMKAIYRMNDFGTTIMPERIQVSDPEGARILLLRILKEKKGEVRFVNFPQEPEDEEEIV